MTKEHLYFVLRKLYPNCTIEVQSWWDAPECQLVIFFDNMYFIVY